MQVLIKSIRFTAATHILDSASSVHTMVGRAQVVTVLKNRYCICMLKMPGLS